MKPRSRFILTLILGSVATLAIGSNAYLLLGRNLESVLIGYGLSIVFMAVVTLLSFRFNLDNKSSAREADGTSMNLRREDTAGREETVSRLDSEAQLEAPTGAVQSAIPIPLEDAPSALTPIDHVAEKAVIPQIYRKIGRSSKIAGLGFVVLSITFLILSVYREYIVFQIDSIVAFLAAIVLLFKDPRARVQARVLDAILFSSGETMEELSVPAGTAFSYVPAKSGVEDVVVTSMPASTTSKPDGASGVVPRLVLTPPGRGLATLFMRENGLTRATVDSLRNSLPKTMCENFGLAESVELDIGEDRVDVILRKPSVICKCGEGKAQEKTVGAIGCNVASFLAVLFCSATDSQISLERCVRDPDMNTWTVSMRLARGNQVTL